MRRRDRRHVTVVRLRWALGRRCRVHSDRKAYAAIDGRDYDQRWYACLPCANTVINHTQNVTMINWPVELVGRSIDQRHERWR